MSKTTDHVIDLFNKELPGELIDIDEREEALRDFYNQEKSDKDFDFMVNNMTEKDV